MTPNDLPKAWREKATEFRRLRAEDQAWPDDGGLGESLAHRGLALCLAAGVFGLGAGIGCDRRNLDQAADSGFAREAGNTPGAKVMQRIEGLAATFLQHTDEVHGRVGAFQRGQDRSIVPHVGLDRYDLTDIAHGLEEQSASGAPHSGADAHAIRGKPPYEVAPDETGRAENCDQGMRHAVALKFRPRQPFAAPATITPPL